MTTLKYKINYQFGKGKKGKGKKPESKPHEPFARIILLQPFTFGEMNFKKDDVFNVFSAADGGHAWQLDNGVIVGKDVMGIVWDWVDIELLVNITKKSHGKVSIDIPKGLYKIFDYNKKKFVAMSKDKNLEKSDIDITTDPYMVMIKPGRKITGGLLSKNIKWAKEIKFEKPTELSEPVKSSESKKKPKKPKKKSRKKIEEINKRIKESQKKYDQEAKKNKNERQILEHVNSCYETNYPSYIIRDFHENVLKMSSFNMLDSFVNTWASQKGRDNELRQGLAKLNKKELNYLPGGRYGKDRLVSKFKERAKDLIKIVNRTGGASRAERKKEERELFEKKRQEKERKKIIQQKQKERKMKREKKKRDAGAAGEEIIEQILNKNKIIPSMYFTQAQLEKIDTIKTPDFLFKTPIRINGKLIKWIDSKNSIIMPKITDGQIITDFKKQIDSYCELYGEGAVIFLNPYLDEYLKTKIYKYPELVTTFNVILRTTP